ncbi:MAG: prephenate dehydrogenase/arogenate dehydrogenase family protein [Anaerolineae bacterium]|nr:prephenate dehydrogenase/arogenate dehydrogenase family protein [Anaerolineae bacterium]
MSKLQVKVAVVGLDRWSTSLALALREQNQQPKAALQFVITGQDERKDHLRTAQELGALDAVEEKMRLVVRQADIVLLSMPPRDLEFAYDVFGGQLKPGAVVLDLSPAKLAAVALAEKHLPRDAEGHSQAYLVGVYPLVHNDYLYDTNREVSAAHRHLFLGSDLLISPAANVPGEAIKVASDLAEILQMRSRFMTPDELDALIHFTETLPLLVSLGLFRAMREQDGGQERERSINPNLARFLNLPREMGAKDVAALLGQHQPFLVPHLDALISSLQGLRADLATQSAEGLADLARKHQAALENWEDQRLKNNWGQEAPPEITRGGMLGGVLGFGGLGRNDRSRR